MKLLDRFRLLKRQQRKALAVLIDPDQVTHDASVSTLIRLADVHQVGFILIGGSHVSEGTVERALEQVRNETGIPAILFPGDPSQICSGADGLFLLSLISGRNAELLIGKHVAAAPRIRDTGVEVLPTGYLLIDSGKPTSVSYISQTQPLPADKPALAASTAMAGEMLGLQLIYLEAGSGAQRPVPTSIIAAVRNAVDTPLLVGGGISSADQLHAAFKAGADVCIVGSAFEKNPEQLVAMSGVVNSWNSAPHQ